MGKKSRKRKRTLVLYYILVVRQNITVKCLINNNRRNIIDLLDEILFLMPEKMTMHVFLKKS